jgi:hypothetical protein
MQTGLLSQTYSVNSNQIVLTPVQPFKPGELVQVSATTRTLNMSGQEPISPTVWQFRVAVEGGSGVFTDSGQSLGGSISRGGDLGDLDGDGDLDAFVVNRNQGNRVWLNNGGFQGGTPGTFNDSGQSLGSANSVRVALGDVDGDGDLDAFVANRENQANKVWLNNGGRQGGPPGVFSENGQNLGSSYSSDVALGDVDGDGDLDAYVVNYLSNQANKVWINNGSGFFIDSGQNLGNSNSIELSLGDVDGDGDLDAYVVNYGDDKVWLNNGGVQGGTMGIFSDSGQNLESSDSLTVALGDVDSDGDLDAFISSVDLATNRVWLNNGGVQGGTPGTFNDSGQSLGNMLSHDVVLGDVDGDGDLDAFTVAVPNQSNKVWLNNGGYQGGVPGVFSDSGQNLGSSESVDAALGDVDGDGDLDAFVVNYGYPTGQANKVWLNESLKRVYLPIMFKPGLTTLYIQTINTGDTTIRIYDLSNTQLLSCTVGNNAKKLCGTFPSIGSYKITAQTTRCGLRTKIFYDATGGTVTRIVECD